MTRFWVVHAGEIMIETGVLRDPRTVFHPDAA